MMPVGSKRSDAPRVVMLVRNAYTHDTRVEKEAQALGAAGYRVLIVADARDDLKERESRADGSEVIRVRRVMNGVPGLRFLLHEIGLAKRMAALGPDVLHAHDSNALLPVALAAARLGVPFVYDAHELWLHRPRRGRGRLYATLFGLYYRILQAWAVPRASAVLTVSGRIARHLERHYSLGRVELVPNYPDAPDDAADGGRRLDALARGELRAEAPIAVHLGGIMANRGLEEIVEAAAMVDGLQLVFLGEGEEWPWLARRAAVLGIADRVHRLGPVPSDEVVAYASSATFGVLATSAEGLNNRYSLPNKLFQYMAAGIPTVAPDLPEIAEVVRSTGCGVVVDASSAAAVAGALRDLLAAPERAREMGDRGRAAIERELNWEVSAARLRAVYERLTPAGERA